MARTVTYLYMFQPFEDLKALVVPFLGFLEIAKVEVRFANQLNCISMLLKVTQVAHHLLQPFRQKQMLHIHDNSISVNKNSM